MSLERTREPGQSCATCRYFQRFDARIILNDPEAMLRICGWQPPRQPYWLPPPYLLNGPSSIAAAVRLPTDGAKCAAYRERTDLGERARPATEPLVRP